MSDWAPVLRVMDSALESDFPWASGSDSASDSAPESATEFDSASDSQPEPALSLAQLLPSPLLRACVDFVWLVQHLAWEQTNTSS